MADKPDGSGAPENKGPEQGETGKSAASGFPVGTPLAEMTVDEREAYWRLASRKHEDSEKALRAELDRLKGVEAEAIKLREAAMSEAEKALAAARDEARREGENLGAASWQKVAVTEAVIGVAKAAGRYSSDEDREAVDALLSMIDPASLITAEGTLDRGRIEKALSGLAVKPVGPVRVSSGLAGHVSRLRPGGSMAGSVQAVRDLAAAKYKSK
jgi:hypothetical protein